MQLEKTLGVLRVSAVNYPRPALDGRYSITFTVIILVVPA